ncbi:MAG TPA: hypothetical protein VHF00_07710 [Acidimicrobiales bacterium]|nr:hypothetical protein [Acidimicrobiales bacterium]
MSISTDPVRPAQPPRGNGDEDRKVRRSLLLFAISLVVVGLGGLVAVTFGRDDDPTNRREPGEAESAEEAGPSADGIGPFPGEEIVAYSAGRAQALATAKGDRVAVVSLKRYMTEPEARAAMGRLEVVNLLAAAPAGSPSVVTGTMADWVNGQVGGNRSERDEIQRLLPTVDDPQFKAFYEEEVARLNNLIDSVKPEGPHVFAVTVRGPTPDLQALAAAPDVRLVDVGPSAKLPPDTPLRGLRPEETERANEPPTRPE